MSQCETVKVRSEEHEAGYKTINKDDFDPIKHVPYDAQPAKEDHPAEDRKRKKERAELTDGNR